jgi:hypothetical protein
MMRRTLVVALTATLLAASCGGGDGATEEVDPTVESTAGSVEETVVDSTQPDSAEPDSAGADPAEPNPTESTELPDASSEPILAVPDAATIVQITPTSGGGTRPLLAWEPVDGAAEYLVIVFADDAQPYWSTITDQTETHIGGAQAIPEGVDGPQVADGYSWAVYADDETGAPIASSALRPIAP